MHKNNQQQKTPEEFAALEMKSTIRAKKKKKKETFSIQKEKTKSKICKLQSKV